MSWKILIVGIFYGLIIKIKIKILAIKSLNGFYCFDMSKIDSKIIERLNHWVGRVSYCRGVRDEDTDDYAVLIVTTSSNLLKVFYVEEKPDEVAVLFVRLI